MPQTFNPDQPTCPECGSTNFTIDPKAERGEHYHPGYLRRGADLPIRMRPAVVAFCNECEFCHEIRP